MRKEPDHFSETHTQMILLFVGKNGKSFCERLIDYQYSGLSFDNMSKATAWLVDQKQQLIVPFAIICDLQLPDGNAFELCRFTQEDEQLSPVIFIVVARNFLQADKDRASELGIDAYFPYPPMGWAVHQKLDSIYQTRKQQNKLVVQYPPDGGFLRMIKSLVLPART